MNAQEQYWDKKIEEWTDASYGYKKVSFVEKIASLFRSQISGRMEVALERIGPIAEGKTIVDMGCGLGDFCFRLAEYNPKQIIGLDISGVAVRKATEIVRKRELGHKVKFLQANLTKEKNLPKFDVAVGLGFIDYFNEKELKHLFNLLSGHHFFFSLFEKKPSLRNLIHNLYVRWQGCPGAYKYTRREIMAIVPCKYNLRFYERKGMLFITDLPNL